MRARAFAPYLISLCAVIGTTAILVSLRPHLNETTVALALLIVVLFLAAAYDIRSAVAASVAAMLAFNCASLNSSQAAKS